MYKTIFTVTMLLTMFFSFQKKIVAQEIVTITYTKSFVKKIDTSKASQYKDQISKMNALLDYHANDLSYNLIISDFHSEFKENKVLSSDNDENDIIKKLAGSIGGTKGVFYVNKRDSIFINAIKFLDQDFRIKMETGNWSITKETKLIDNYTCFKATRTDSIDNSVVGFKANVTAWFCPTLPSFYGPANYFGLPGTILEVNNGIMSLQAIKIKLEDKQIKEEFKRPSKGKLLTKNEYDKLIRKMAEDKYQLFLKN